MKCFKYIKSNAFTVGNSQGNPAACLFVGADGLSDSEMQTIAREHKGAVMETVFLSPSAQAHCLLTYYSSECEVDFCGHGTIATMYSVVCDDPSLRNVRVISVETRRKGFINVYNEIDSEDALYIEAPEAIEYPVHPALSHIADALSLSVDSLDMSHPVRIIDAGLRTLVVGLASLSVEVSLYPDEQSLKLFCLANDIDIILVYSMEVADEANFAHTRVFAPRFGYLEDPATGSGNSAFAHYLLSEQMWDGSPVTVEQGGDNRVFNAVKLKALDGKILFGGKATKKIDGFYYI